VANAAFFIYTVINQGGNQLKDILLTADGDLDISEAGDISLTDSVRQAVRIRLYWFFQEWRFAPMFGIPYFEIFLVKKPNLEKIRRIVRDEVMSVDEVIEAKNIRINIDKAPRTANISLDISVAEETYREEVLIYV
jgi:hypothetical protein